jgi:uncharacterized protein (DUF302 family)
MIEQRSQYAISISVNLPHEQAVERIRAELAKEGFVADEARARLVRALEAMQTP